MSRYRTGVSSSYGDEGGESMPAAKERPGLVLLYAPNFEQLSPAYVFVSPELTIGREASNLICVPEQAVSRQHARMFSRVDHAPWSPTPSACWRIRGGCSAGTRS